MFNLQGATKRRKRIEMRTQRRMMTMSLT